MKITAKYKWIIWLYLIDSQISWPNISIFSWIHWDEISWVKAAKKILNQIKSWKIKIKSWKINFLIGANRKAINENKRCIKDNLNRLFDDNLKWSWYEFNRSRELLKILKESDYLLDLHSTSGPSIPYLFSEMQNFPIAKKMWISYIVWWWAELNSASISWDTESYINKLWWAWFTFESWNHLSPEWVKNAHIVSLNFLSILWVIDNNYFNELSSEKNYLKMKEIYVCKTWNFKFKLSDLNNFTNLKKWVLIWVDWDEKIFAKEDMILVMPNLANPKIWEDVFFAWEKI